MSRIGSLCSGYVGLDRCEFDAGHESEHPHGRRSEPPGTPCRYCGDPVPMDGSACAKCWQPMTVPLMKSWAAAEGWNTRVTTVRDEAGP